MKTFSQHATPQWRAGGFPFYRDGEDVFVCLFLSNDPSYGGHDPQIPKGHPDEGENAVQAASREVHEETGIPLSDLRKKPSLVMVKDFVGEVANYKFHVYAFELPERIPAKTNAEGKGVWISLDYARRQMRHDQRIFIEEFAKKM